MVMGSALLLIDLPQNNFLFLRFFVHLVASAPAAKFRELDFALDLLAVAGRPIISVLARGTIKFDEMFLSHNTLFMSEATILLAPFEVNNQNP